MEAIPGIILGVCSVFFAVYTGVSWYILNVAECGGVFYNFVHVYAITMTVLLSICIAFSIVSLITYIFESTVGGIVSIAIMIVVVLVGSIMSLVFFIWGVVILAENNGTCPADTHIWKFILAIVILNGLSVLTSLTNRLNIRT